MKEFELTLRLRNNLLKARRLELGLSPRVLAERIGIGYGRYLEYEGLKRSPLNKKGCWLPSALRIADFFRADPDELWPEAVLLVKQAVLTKRMAAREALALVGYQEERLLEMSLSPEDLLFEKEREQEVNAALSRITSYQSRILKERASGQTLEEVAEQLEVTPERVRQIEQKALRRLRHPSFTRRLKESL